MPGRASITVAFALLVGVFTCVAYAEQASAAANVPDGFSDQTVLDQIDAPIALAFTSDGRMLITSKAGELWVYEEGQTDPSVALDLTAQVCANSAERGLLGVAVDPNFATNHYVYLYYTAQVGPDCDSRNEVNRVSRFTMSGNAVDETIGEDVLVDNIPSPNADHNAGDLHFGVDGKLYVSVGDGGCNYLMPGKCQYENAAARYGNVLLGKILRINPDGSVPDDNPFVDEPDSAPCADEADGQIEAGRVCQETCARGFRNPFRFAVNPNATGPRLFVNDVGGRKWEEIDNLQPGADYGWNLCEGRHDNPDRRGRVDCNGPNFTGPIHEYNHKWTNCESITGGAFVPEGVWPTSYDDAYLFGDFVCGKSFKLTQKAGGGYGRNLFTRVPRPGPIAMDFGPHGTGQALYYTTFAKAQDSQVNGQVRRISRTAGG